MWNRKLTWVVLLAALAVGGYFLRSFIPTLLAEYRQSAEIGPAWGWLYIALAAVSTLAAVALVGWGAWVLVSNSREKSRRWLGWSKNPSQLSRAEIKAEIAAHLAEGQTLADDATLSNEVREAIRQALAGIIDKRQKETLSIVAFGTVSSGKSALLNALAGRDAFRTDARGGTTVVQSELPWPDDDRVALVDTPGLAEIQGGERQELAKRAARDADLVLFVTDGPLRDFEAKFLGQLAEMEKPLVICLNKEDWFSSDDRELLIDQLAQQIERWAPRENVVAVRALPAARVRTRVLHDGSQCEERVEVEPDIRALAGRMQSIVKQQGQELLLANLLLQSRGMVSEAHANIRTQLDDRAMAIVDRAMWQAGAAAALSPLPVIDLAAGAGITSHMVLELAKVYRQSVDLDMVSRLLAELGKQLVSVAGANLAAPAAASAVASVLKTVPGAGTLTGGALQGLVQVLVTRWIGKVFIAYFRSGSTTPQIAWADLARAKWAEVTRPEELAGLVKAGIARLGKGKS